MIEALLERHEELMNLVGVEGDFLRPDEEIELRGIKEILGDFGFTYIACS